MSIAKAQLESIKQKSLKQRDQWGPVIWQWLHTFSIMYPDVPTPKHKEIFINNVKYMIANLPCDECVKHATTYMRNNPIDISSCSTVQAYMYTFHNAVNKRIGKHVMKPEDYRKKYIEIFRIKKIHHK